MTATLSAGALVRIGKADEEARQTLAAELKLLGVEAGKMVDSFPAFKAYAAARFDARSQEYAKAMGDPGNYERILHSEVTDEILRGIFPDETRRRLLAGERLPAEVSVVQCTSEGPILEVECEGVLRPARREIRAVHAPLGDWEALVSDAVGHTCKLWPDDAEVLERSLRQHLCSRAFYWVGKVSPLETTAIDGRSDAGAGTARRPNDRRNRILELLRAADFFRIPDLASAADIDRSTAYRMVASDGHHPTPRVRARILNVVKSKLSEQQYNELKKLLSTP